MRRYLPLLAILFAAVGFGCQAPPPESVWIAFASGRSGLGDIYAVSPETGDLVVVQGSPETEGAPKYDSARNRLVYIAMENGAPHMGSGGELFSTAPQGESPPNWSPDGNWIVYSADRGEGERLYRAGSDGAPEERITEGPFPERHPSWSPDGSSVVFIRDSNQGWELVSVNLTDGRRETRLTMSATYLGNPVWSPDGGFIAFEVSLEGDVQIAILSVGSRSVTRILRREGDDVTPAWSPDGRRLAFGGEVGGGGNREIWLMDFDLDEMRPLTDDPGFDGGPVFVPGSAIGW